MEKILLSIPDPVVGLFICTVLGIIMIWGAFFLIKILKKEFWGGGNNKEYDGSEVIGDTPYNHLAESCTFET
jgi:hypothetical protein